MSSRNRKKRNAGGAERYLFLRKKRRRASVRRAAVLRGVGWLISQRRTGSIQGDRASTVSQARISAMQAGYVLLQLSKRLWRTNMPRNGALGMAEGGKANAYGVACGKSRLPDFSPRRKRIWYR